MDPYKVSGTLRGKGLKGGGIFFARWVFGFIKLISPARRAGLFIKLISPTRRAVLKAFGVAEVLSLLARWFLVEFLIDFRLRGERVCLRQAFP